MNRLLLITALSALTLQAVHADDPAPSEASIRELLTITQAGQMIDATMAQVDAAFKASMQQALGEQTLTDEQRRIIEDMRSEMMGMLNEQMDWSTLEPMFVEIYTKSFTQQEVDGMLTFYRSEAGQAVIAKMPVVLEHTMQAMQARMGTLMPRIQALQKETMAQLKATEKN